ncbi:MAG: hypothetical protein U1F25_05330 [Rubrivivax sp.]
MKIRGRWVNLVELAEKLTAQAGGVNDGAAVCVPDADGVDAVAYFYVTSDGERARAALEQVAATLPPYQRPRWLHAIDSFPRGPPASCCGASWSSCIGSKANSDDRRRDANRGGRRTRRG